MAQEEEREIVLVAMVTSVQFSLFVCLTRQPKWYFETAFIVFLFLLSFW